VRFQRRTGIYPRWSFWQADNDTVADLFVEKERCCLYKTKPTPDWKGGAARPPQAGRSESVALESGLTI